MPNLSDYLEAIADKPEFIHIKKESYDVIDYVYVTSTTFVGSPLLLDCRGIKFDKSGNIIARPLHKFFNLDESQAAFSLDGKTRFYVQEKRDGSMVHSVILNGEVCLMTRKGITDISISAERYLTNAHKEIIIGNPNWTYIFEYTSPDNRIVIGYDEPELTLLAIRNIRTGEYYRTHSQGAVIPTVHEYVGSEIFNKNEPEYKYVGAFSRLGNLNFDNHGEGVVLVEADNFFHRVKVKTEEYVRIHSMVSNFNFMSMKKKFEICINGNVDDYAAFLDEKTFSDLRLLNDRVQNTINGYGNAAEHICLKTANLTSKEFAEHLQSQIRKELHSFLYTYRKGGDWRRIVENLILKEVIEIDVSRV